MPSLQVDSFLKDAMTNYPIRYVSITRSNQAKATSPFKERGIVLWIFAGI
jgi:hypothetical protein